MGGQPDATIIINTATHTSRTGSTMSEAEYKYFVMVHYKCTLHDLKWQQSKQMLIKVTRPMTFQLDYCQLFTSVFKCIPLGKFSRNNIWHLVLRCSWKDFPLKHYHATSRLYKLSGRVWMIGCDRGQATFSVQSTAITPCMHFTHKYVSSDLEPFSCYMLFTAAIM